MTSHPHIAYLDENALYGYEPNDEVALYPLDDATEQYMLAHYPNALVEIDDVPPFFAIPAPAWADIRASFATMGWQIDDILAI